MKTYVEVLISADGEKASLISQKLYAMGLKPSFGEHDFEYDWKEEVVLPEVLNFVDEIQKELKGTGAILKFNTIR